MKFLQTLCNLGLGSADSMQGCVWFRHRLCKAVSDFCRHQCKVGSGFCRHQCKVAFGFGRDCARLGLVSGDTNVRLGLVCADTMSGGLWHSTWCHSPAVFAQHDVATGCSRESRQVSHVSLFAKQLLSFVKLPFDSDPLPFRRCVMALIAMSAQCVFLPRPV